jgi:hypothetical protein
MITREWQSQATSASRRKRTKGKGFQPPSTQPLAAAHGITHCGEKEGKRTKAREYFDTSSILEFWGLGGEEHILWIYM